MDINSRITIEKGIEKSGLRKKQWFSSWYRGFGVLHVLIPILISGLSVYFGYFKIETIMILVSVLIVFILSGFASQNLFKKEGDSKSMLIFRALTLPLGYIAVCVFIWALTFVL